MSEYIIQGETLSALADEVRTLSGTSDEMSTDTMKGNLQAANTEIDEQAEKLDELEAAIDELPEAGSAVETCTMSPEATHTISTGVFYTAYENGTFDGVFASIPKEGNVINNIVKNSVVVFSTIVNSSSNLELLNNSVTTYAYGYKITGDATYACYTCFVAGTQIILADGSTKPIEDITHNDQLLVWDFDNGCYSAAKPVWIKQEQTAPYYYRCTFEDGTILNLVGSNSKCHRVFDLELNRFESATDCVGKMVSAIDGSKKLVSCECIDEEVKFFNIITEYHLNLFAENILTSCRLNNLYPIEDMKYVKEERELIPFEAYADATLKLYKGLRLGERKSEDVSMINEYVNRLVVLSASKEV